MQRGLASVTTTIKCMFAIQANWMWMCNVT